MLLIFVKDHCLLKNNWTLISVNKSMLLRGSCCCGSWTATTKSWCLHQPRLGRPLRRVQLTLVPLPWPRRGTSSSLQGVWQACSPINCLCSSLVWTKRHHHPLLHCTDPLPVSFTNRETSSVFAIIFFRHVSVCTTPPPRPPTDPCHLEHGRTPGVGCRGRGGASPRIL